jgi:hypothetical protein
LHVGLKRVVPEALKPRKISVGSSAPAVTAPTPIANDSQNAAKAA